MRTPRIKIIWAMAFVAFAALNFGAIRAMSDVRRELYRAQTMEQFNRAMDAHKTVDILQYGALPMANILTLGLLVGCLRRGSRRFVWGFETFGVLVLILFVIIACFRVNDLTELFAKSFAKLVTPLVRRPNGSNFPMMDWMIIYSTAIVWLVLPQITIAVAGGFLTRYFQRMIR